MKSFWYVQKWCDGTKKRFFCFVPWCKLRVLRVQKTKIYHCVILYSQLFTSLPVS